MPAWKYTAATTLLYLVLSLLLVQPCFSASYVNRLDVQQLITELEAEYGIKRQRLEELFATVKKQEKVLERKKKPSENLPWYRYRKIFLTQERMEAGMQFWRMNHAALNRASRRYTVPAQIITAIIGVETYYGKYMGEYPVLDTLTTLAFDYPSSATFFQKELVAFLVLCTQELPSCKNIYGSYAGAMGYAQFLPSSYRAYSVDADEDGRRMLWEDPADSIASVGNYLQAHGWEKSQPYFNVVPWPRDASYQAKHIFNTKFDTWFNIPQLTAVSIDTSLWMIREQPFMLWEFEKELSTHLVLAAYNNSYVISRYNQSSKYVLAVLELASAIAHKMATKNAEFFKDP